MVEEEKRKENWMTMKIAHVECPSRTQPNGETKDVANSNELKIINEKITISHSHQRASRRPILADKTVAVVIYRRFDLTHAEAFKKI